MNGAVWVHMGGKEYKYPRQSSVWMNPYSCSTALCLEQSREEQQQRIVDVIAFQLEDDHLTEHSFKNTLEQNH